MGQGLQVAILVGGKGTRLGALTADTPKPLLQVAGRSILERLIVSVVQQGASQVVLLAGHLGEQMQALADQADRLGVEILCAVEPAPAGTGGALMQARDLLQPEFLLLNGDSFFDFDISDLMRLGRETPDALGVLALRQVEDLSRYGSVTLEGDRITGFAEKRPGLGVMNGGVYWLRREVLDYISASPCSLEQDVFPALSADGRLLGRLYSGFFIDIGVPEDFKRAQRELPLALDRRGKA